jgi:hypothetical protein
MISTLSIPLSMQSSSHTEVDRPTLKRLFVDFDLDRSRASRHRHRVLSSARKTTAWFHQEFWPNPHGESKLTNFQSRENYSKRATAVE